MDVIFISYNEPNADENYKDLLTKFPYAKRVHNITGLYESHYEASKLNESDYYITIDGDTQIWKDALPTPNFTKPDQIFYYPTKNSILKTHASGSIKFWSKDVIKYVDKDYFNKIGEWYLLDNISNVVNFRNNNFVGETIINSSPKQAFIASFRETFKACKIKLNRTNDLLKWCQHHDVKNGEWATLGARTGVEFAFKNTIGFQDVNNWQILDEIFKSNKLKNNKESLEFFLKPYYKQLFKGAFKLT